MAFRESLLDEAVQRAIEWIHNQALRASNIGQSQADNIFSDVVKRIATFGEESEPSAEELHALGETLTSIAQRNETFRSFGLTPKLDVGEITNSIARSSKKSQALIKHVLTPYVDGLRARLDALQILRDLIDKLVENLNEFYKNKKIRFTLSEGFKINFTNGEPLEPKDLSSGEKQLLFLLCNTLSARSNSSIFIIDEPEISLNVKWQRLLIGALFDCMSGSGSQLIIATHSIEMLAQHRRSVTKLVDLENAQ